MRLTLCRCDFGGLRMRGLRLSLRGHADSTSPTPLPQLFFQRPVPAHTIPPRASLLTTPVSFISPPASLPSSRVFFISPSVCLLAGRASFISTRVCLPARPVSLISGCVFLHRSAYLRLNTPRNKAITPCNDATIPQHKPITTAKAPPPILPIASILHRPRPSPPNFPTTLPLRLPAPLSKCRSHLFGTRRLYLFINLNRRFDVSDSLCAVTEFVERQA
jgi:hypothetical protein